MTQLLPPKGSTSADDLALAGLGAPAQGKLHFVTGLNRTPPNEASALVTPAAQDRTRLSRQVYACSEDFPCTPFAHDMLSRAAAIADGNGFFGDYNPDAYKRASLGRTGGREPVDLGLQYRSEAVGALKALDGLNIPPDLLVRAAFVGKSADRLCPANQKPTTQGAIEDLAQLCIRLLCDQPNAADAGAAVSAFRKALELTFQRTGLSENE